MNTSGIAAAPRVETLERRQGAVTFVHRHLSAAAPAHDRHRLPPIAHSGTPVAAVDDRARKLHAGDVERLPAVDQLRSRVEASSLQQVRAIERGRGDGDDHLVRAGCRLGTSFT
jgi:hypothetical protein